MRVPDEFIGVDGAELVVKLQDIGSVTLTGVEKIEDLPQRKG